MCSSDLYCRHHVVFVPKYRKRAIFGSLRKAIGGILRQLCQQEGVELVEGHALPDHVHLCLSIPPKYSVANTVGFLKGKSAIRIHREFLGRERNFTATTSGREGYCVSTMGWTSRRSESTSAIRRKTRNGRSNSHSGGFSPLPPGRRGDSPFHYPKGPTGALHQAARYAGGS